MCVVFPGAFLISCRNHDRVYDRSVFEEKDLLPGKSLAGVPTPVPELRKSSRIKIIPKYNLILTLDMGTGDYLAQAFSLDSCKYLRSFIKRGTGSGEQLSAESIHYRPGEKVIYVADEMKNIIFIYSPDSILRALTVRPTDSIKAWAEPLNRPVVLAGKSFADLRWNRSNTAPIADFRSVGVYNFFSPSGALINYGGRFPATSNAIDVNQLTEAFFGRPNLSDDNTRIVYAYYNTDIIDLCDLHGGLIKRVQGPDGFEPSVRTLKVGEGEEIVPRKDARFGYTGTPRMNNNTLLVLYNGTSQEKNEYHTSRLYQFDSSLVPKVFYRLSEPIFDFDVDWGRRRIYGLTHLKDKTIITFKF